MLDREKLQQQMTRQGYNSEDVAKNLGISTKFFNYKLKTGDFGLDEAYRLVELLEIIRPETIFFPRK